MHSFHSVESGLVRVQYSATLHEVRLHEGGKGDEHEWYLLHKFQSVELVSNWLHNQELF